MKLTGKAFARFGSRIEYMCAFPTQSTIGIAFILSLFCMKCLMYLTHWWWHTEGVLTGSRLVQVIMLIFFQVVFTNL